MTITTESIAKVNHVVEKDLNDFNHFMLHSISLSFDDDKNTIEQKIKTIDFLKSYLLNSIKIGDFSF